MAEFFLALLVGVILLLIPKIYKSLKKPNIYFHSLSAFQIEKGTNCYGIGLVLDIYNNSESSILISDIDLTEPSVDLAARGSAEIKRIVNRTPEIIIQESVFIKPNSSSKIKARLPITLDMEIKSGLPFEIILFGKWEFTASNKKIRLSPKYHESPKKIINEEEWDNLIDRYSEILNNTDKKETPERIQRGKPIKTYLLFNHDRTANFKQYGFGTTGYVRNDKGAMVFIIGHGNPTLVNGWTNLGNTYPSVWNSPEKLALYNSVQPPDRQGPVPFGSFAGREKEMGLTRSTATTCTRDILHIPLTYDFDKAGFGILDLFQG